MANEISNNTNSADQDVNDPVAIALGGLARVEAPPNFETRVMARIASRSSSPGAWHVPAGLRFAMPLAALLLIVGAFFGLRPYLAAGDQPVAGIADVVNKTDVPARTMSPVITEPASQTEPDSAVVASTKGDSDSAKPAADVSSRPMPPPPVDRTYVDAAHSGVKILPAGLNANVRVAEKPRDLRSDKSFSPTEILEQIGIGTRLTAAGITVDSVKDNSLAARAGLKAGDVIEAINDRNVDPKTVFGGQFSGRSVRVRRDGKSLKIDLIPH